jgi:beta-glucosidase-like glycosyl hydrolase
MSDEREQILSAVDYWRLHANDPKAQGGFAGATVTDLLAILDAYDAMKQRAEAAEASCAVAWASMETMQGVIDTLTRERDEARVVTDAMVERVARVILSRRVSYTGKNAEKAWLWYGNDFKHEAREYLTAALSEAT